MKAGGEHWQWNPNIPFYIGCLPRRGAKSSDVKVRIPYVLSRTGFVLTIYQWFRAPNAFPGHTANAFETPDGKIAFDLPVSDKNVFFWWPDADGNAPDPHDITADMQRFTIDPTSDNLELPRPELLLKKDCEFSRIDERFSMKPYNHIFFLMMDPSLGSDMSRIVPFMGGGFPPYNTMSHLNIETKQLESYLPGPTHLVQEPVFVPRSDDAPEGDGWLMALVNNYTTMASELHIVDTRNFTKAQAVVELPVRLRMGLHGNWVAAQELELLSNFH